MANVLTSLRKLGVQLVGDDGLLTNAAMVKLGMGPMKQYDMVTKAREVANTERKDAEDILTQEANRDYNAVYRKESLENLQSLQDTRGETQKRAQLANAETERQNNIREQAEIRRAQAEGFVKPDGTVDLEAFRAKTAADEMEDKILDAQGYVRVDPETAAQYSKRGYNIGFDPKRGVAKKTAIAAADKFLNADSALNRTNLTVNAGGDRAENAYKASHLKLFRAETKNEETAINNAEIALAALQPFEGKMLDNVARENIAVMLFQKGLDPSSVVRNEEYARLLIGSPLVDTIKQTFAAIKLGGQVPDRTVREAVRGLQLMAKLARERQKRMAESFAEDSNTSGYPIPVERFLTPSSFAEPAAANSQAPTRSGKPKVDDVVNTIWK